MRKFTRRQIHLLAGGALASVGCTSTGAGSAALPADYYEATPAPFPQFGRRPENPDYTLGFSSWSGVIRRYVIDFGPSDRVGLSRPEPEMGSRFARGHASPYRAEGARIPFSLFEESDAQVFAEARAVLEKLGDDAPFERVRWSDQLAFWFNLHNAALIEQIALAYPVKRPGGLRVGPQRLPLLDAKLVRVQGTPLSLRDIRQEIVYRYWRHPGVLYGFWRGEVGGPSIRRGAFTGSAVNKQLGAAAEEFVNSLRGVRAYGARISISRIYEDAVPFFDDWRTGLRAHLSAFADGDVAELLASDAALYFGQYDQTVADLAGGDTGSSSKSPTPTTGVYASTNQRDIGRVPIGIASQLVAAMEVNRTLTMVPGLPEHAGRVLRERARKLVNVRRRTRRRRGIVTIDDLPTAPVE